MGISLYWWQERRVDGRENYGDLMSKYLVEKISGKRIRTVPHPSKRLYKHFLKHYLAIGSIISSANKNSVVWGSGIIKKDDNIRNAKFVAVRGPKTRDRIIEKGFNCPECFGDPALLMPLYYPNKIKKKYNLGIVPHYVDYNEVSDHFKDDITVKVIDLLTKDVEHTTNEILECEKIISSSLHGLIVSHAYFIPALWVKFSDKLSGDDIKFYDYYSSLKIPFLNEIFIHPKTLNTTNFTQLFKTNQNVNLPDKRAVKDRIDDLIQSCPF